MRRLSIYAMATAEQSSVLVSDQVWSAGDFVHEDGTSHSPLIAEWLLWALEARLERSILVFLFCKLSYPFHKGSRCFSPSGKLASSPYQTAAAGTFPHREISTTVWEGTSDATRSYLRSKKRGLDSPKRTDWVTSTLSPYQAYVWRLRPPTAG